MHDHKFYCRIGLLMFSILIMTNEMFCAQKTSTNEEKGFFFKQLREAWDFMTCSSGSGITSCICVTAGGHWTSYAFSRVLLLQCVHIIGLALDILFL